MEPINAQQQVHCLLSGKVQPQEKCERGCQFYWKQDFLGAFNKCILAREKAEAAMKLYRRVKVE